MVQSTKALVCETIELVLSIMGCDSCAVFTVHPPVRNVYH